MAAIRQKVKAVVYESSHTTPGDANAFLSRVRKEDANVVVLPTEFNVKAFNKLKRKEEVDFGTRYSKHDVVLVQGLLKIFREKKGKFSVVQLKEPSEKPSSHQLEEIEFAKDWRKRGWERQPGKVEEPKKAARRTQEELHAEAADLGKFIGKSIAQGQLDPEKIASKIRRQAVATTIRREMLRRSLLDLPTSLHQQQPVLGQLPKLKVVVQVSGTYGPSAKNAAKWIGMKGPRQGEIHYDLDFRQEKDRPRLTRVSLVHQLVDKQQELMRQLRAPSALLAKYFFKDTEIPERTINRIVFEELLERALREKMPESHERFEAVTRLSEKLPQNEMAHFIKQTLSGKEKPDEISQAYSTFLDEMKSHPQMKGERKALKALQSSFHALGRK